MEEDIESNTRREFERFLIAILQCQREEGVDAIDEDGAEEDAQELFDVSITIFRISYSTIIHNFVFFREKPR